MKRWNAIMLTLCVAMSPSVAVAQQPSALQSPAGPHGGKLHQVGNFQCESVFSSKAIEVFVYDNSGQPIAARGARGQINIAIQGDARTYRYDLYPQSGEAAAPNALGIAIDLNGVQDGKANITFALYGLGAQPATFTTPFHRSLSSEQLAISRQRTCPVSGKPLGSMGAPPKVRIGDQDIYVCCAGCTDAIAAQPAMYLAKLADPAPGKATTADKTAITRQRMCPVMDEPLMSMGGPWKVTVQGQTVFVCCKGCIKKVQERPSDYLKKVAILTTTQSPRLRR